MNFAKKKVYEKNMTLYIIIPLYCTKVFVANGIKYFKMIKFN